jgi:hypothetical protein
LTAKLTAAAPTTPGGPREIAHLAERRDLTGHGTRNFGWFSARRLEEAGGLPLVHRLTA